MDAETYRIRDNALRAMILEKEARAVASLDGETQVVEGYVTKDSGVREEFSSGMVRDTEKGKTLWHLVASGPMLKRWAELLTRGAEKYSANNWLKADGESEEARFKASAFRHFMQWYAGETDEDHAAAVFFNINGAEYVKSCSESEHRSPSDRESRAAAKLLARRELFDPSGDLRVPHNGDR